jgi:hypothetical protein
VTTPTPKPLSAAQQVARIQKSLNDQRAQMVPGPLVRQPANAARLAAILHMAAMDLWDVATEQDQGQMWEEARAIASRILAACPSP